MNKLLFILMVIPISMFAIESETNADLCWTNFVKITMAAKSGDYVELMDVDEIRMCVKELKFQVSIIDENIKNKIVSNDWLDYLAEHPFSIMATASLAQKITLLAGVMTGEHTTFVNLGHRLIVHSQLILQMADYYCFVFDPSLHDSYEEGKQNSYKAGVGDSRKSK